MLMYAPLEHCSSATMHTGIRAATTFPVLRTAVNEVEQKHIFSLTWRSRILSGVSVAPSQQNLYKGTWHLCHVCLSVCGKLKNCWMDIHAIRHWEVWLKSVKTFCFWLKVDNIKPSALRPACICISTWIVINSSKVTLHYIQGPFFPLSLAIFEMINMEWWCQNCYTMHLCHSLSFSVLTPKHSDWLWGPSSLLFNG